MKRPTYPNFRLTCIVNIQLPENKSTRPDIAIRVKSYIQHWGDIHSAAKREAVWNLERLGVDKETLKFADFETDDCAYEAVDPKGVRREFGVPVEAFYLCDPKKRDVLIKQCRLVPDSYEDMVAMYGKPVKATADEVAA